jgi:pantothenate kinase
MEKGVISIHFPKENENIEVFEYKMQENDIKVIEWEKAGEDLQKDIQRECGSKISTEKKLEKGGLYKVGFAVGKMLGSIDKLVSKPAKAAQQVHNSAASKLEETVDKKIGDETKSKWESVKGKAISINLGIGGVLQPAGDKAM